MNLPGRSEKRSIDRPEAGEADKDRDDPGHDTEVVVPKILKGTQRDISHSQCPQKLRAAYKECLQKSQRVAQL